MLVLGVAAAWCGLGCDAWWLAGNHAEYMRAAISVCWVVSTLCVFGTTERRAWDLLVALAYGQLAVAVAGIAGVTRLIRRIESN